MVKPLPSRYKGQTVLAVGAHPDDIEIGIGGTVARLKDIGARVVMLVGCIPTEYEKRVVEAEKSAKILGAELRFMFNHGCARVEDAKTYNIVKILDDLM